MGTQLENKIIRARERFSSIPPVNYAENTHASMMLAYTARRLFDSYLDNFSYAERQQLKANSLPTLQALAVVAEAAEECTTVLNIQLPYLRVTDFGEESDALERVIVIDGKAVRIEINSRFITEAASGFAHSSDYPSHREKRYLRELTAQEVYHLKIMQQFPATHRRTEAANQSSNPSDYDNDRGERATLLFGSSYARYKQMCETYPERIKQLSFS